MLPLRSLSLRVVLFAIALNVQVPVVGVALMLNVRSARVYEETGKHTLQAIAGTIAASIEAELRSQTDAALALARAPALVSGNAAATAEAIATFLLYRSHWQEVIRLDRNGVPIGRQEAVPNTPPATLLPLQEPDRGRLHDTLTRGTVSIFAEAPRPGTTSISIGLAVPVRQDGTIVGALVAIVHLAVFTAYFGIDDEQRSGFAALVDAQGMVIAHSDLHKIGTLVLPPDVPSGATEAVVTSLRTETDDTSVEIAIRRLSLVPWRVAYGTPSSGTSYDFLTHAGNLRLLLALLALSVTAALVVGRYLGRHLDAFVAMASIGAQEGAMVPARLSRIWEIAEVQRALLREAALLQERTQARDRLEDAYRAVQRLQAVDAYGHLAAALAHDFGNVIYAISGNLMLLEQNLTDTEHAQRLIASCRGLMGEATSLVSQLSAVARGKRRSAERLNINAVLDETMELLRHVAGRNINVRVRKRDGLWDCWLDPLQFKSALLNLVLNARAAMPHGGSFAIVTRNVVVNAADAMRFKLPGMGDYVAVAAADSGVGMPPEVLQHIFAPLFTARGATTGTGLGLTLTHDFVAAAGGGIRVRSTPGKGTSFTLYFPRLSSNENVAPTAMPPPTRTDGW